MFRTASLDNDGASRMDTSGVHTSLSLAYEVVLVSIEMQSLSTKEQVFRLSGSVTFSLQVAH